MTNKIPQSLLILAAGALFCIGSASAQNSNTSGAGAGQVDPDAFEHFLATAFGHNDRSISLRAHLPSPRLAQ